MLSPANITLDPKPKAPKPFVAPQVPRPLRAGALVASACLLAWLSVGKQNWMVSPPRCSYTQAEYNEKLC